MFGGPATLASALQSILQSLCIVRQYSAPNVDIGLGLYLRDSSLWTGLKVWLESLHIFEDLDLDDEDLDCFSDFYTGLYRLRAL